MHYEDDDEPRVVNPLVGKRIFVLTPTGETLHVYTHPHTGVELHSMVCFRDQLIAQYETSTANTSMEARALVVLDGV